MWKVIKFEKNYYQILQSNILKKVGNDCKFYFPKIKINFFKRNKLISKEISLLGNYFFCYHPKLKDSNLLNYFKTLKGLKYVLDGNSSDQKEILDFIDDCKKNEDISGFIKLNFVKLILNKNYVFKSGIFVNKIFQLISFNKNFIEIALGDIKTKIARKKYLFEAV